MLGKKGQATPKYPILKKDLPISAPCIYLTGPSLTNIVHLLRPFLNEKRGQYLTGKNLKQKETRSKHRNCTSLLPRSKVMAVWRFGDTASFTLLMIGY